MCLVSDYNACKILMIKEIIRHDPLFTSVREMREGDPQRQDKQAWSFDKGRWPTKDPSTLEERGPWTPKLEEPLLA